MTEKTFIAIVKTVISDILLYQDTDSVAAEMLYAMSDNELENEIGSTLEKLYYTPNRINEFIPVLQHRGIIKININSIKVDVEKVIFSVVVAPKEIVNFEILIGSSIVCNLFDFRSNNYTVFIEDCINIVIDLVCWKKAPDWTYSKRFIFSYGQH